jgi:acetylornithine deacetylase/succinyl-diaminopimelate desuccinylase-like protein
MPTGLRTELAGNSCATPTRRTPTSPVRTRASNRPPGGRCDDGLVTENSARPATGEDEVAAICSDLIRIDTSNRGDHSGPGERGAAEHVATLLAEVGLEPTILESHPGRASVVTRIAGTDSSRPALLIHGHLDVVPADPADWAVHPFSGDITADDLTGPQVWGRGAVDMKDMDAMMLAVIRQRLREGRRPPRDVVLAFLADEEAGGVWGARWLTDNHPGLFEGVTEAIGEVGGFSATLGGQRLYLVQTAEKGMAWLRLTLRGAAGHGSMRHPGNVVTELAETVVRIGRHEWPTRLTPAAQEFLEAAAVALGIELPPGQPGPDLVRQVLEKLGPLARMIGATVSNTANPTVLNAGYKVNVVPGLATADVDGRFVPGYGDEFLEEIDSLLSAGVQREFIHHDIAVETGFDGALCDAMTSAILAADPSAKVVPYCLSGGTDAKSFSRLGIRCFGFAPLRLPAELDFFGMFHGVDERVPVDALKFGVRVLDDFLDRC